jgi:hypothetical protein
MTTRKDLEAKCEELADAYLQKHYVSCVGDIDFKAGFTAALNLTWPLLEERDAKLKVYEEALNEAKWFCQDQRARANEAINTVCSNEDCDYQCGACIRSIDDCEDLVLKINKAIEQAKGMK